ncbi:MAG TPA: hypothetical protein VIU13_20220, partial [Chryseolinea sp.]
MITSSASALILIGVLVGSNAVACFNKRGLDASIYDSGLVHQISLSNLAGEYALINITDENIRTSGG